jgi:hypothetical protein
MRLRLRLGFSVPFHEQANSERRPTALHDHDHDLHEFSKSFLQSTLNGGG